MANPKFLYLITILSLAMPFVLGHEEDEMMHAMTGMTVAGYNNVSIFLSIISLVLIIILIYFLINKRHKYVKK